MEIIVILKPDIVMNNQIAAIKADIKENLWTIEYTEIFQLNKSFLEKFYYEYKNEDFFVENIVKNMTASPIIAMIVKTHSKITNFEQITEIKKDIRSRFAKDKSNNSLHVSDSFENASRERELFGWIA